MCQNTSEVITNEPNLDQVPISALRHPTLCFISQSLNPTKILCAENNCQRDWRGFAHLASLNINTYDFLLTEADPTLKVLKLWADYNQRASIQDFLDILAKIDRWDVADDIFNSLLEDARFYTFKTNGYGNVLNIVQNSGDIDGSFRNESNDHHVINSDIDTRLRRNLTDSELIQQDTSQILEQEIPIYPNDVIVTRSDIDRAEQNLPLQRYDAFVIFAEADLPFAQELVDRMEKHPQFKFELCLKDRDILGGVSFEHHAVMGLIRERCNRLIVIVSNAFLESSLNNFFVQYAAALQIEKGCRKIIPCLYEECEIPRVLNCFSSLKYQQTGHFYDFWSRLSDSIRAGRLEYARTINASTSSVNSLTVQQPFKAEDFEINGIHLSQTSESHKKKKSKWYKCIRKNLIKNLF